MAPPAFDDHFREQLATLFAWRRDVRRFRTDPLDQAEVAALIEQAQAAPSVGNSQPWRFVRIVTPALRGALAQHIDDEVRSAADRYVDPGQRSDYLALKLHGLREAPEVIAVFCDDETPIGAGLGSATMPEARAYSVVLAIHTLWLAARARGIALGWISILRPGWLKQTLAIPDSWKLVALLCLGRAECDANVPELETRGWQDRLPWETNVFER